MTQNIENTTIEFELTELQKGDDDVECLEVVSDQNKTSMYVLVKDNQYDVVAYQQIPYSGNYTRRASVSENGVDAVVEFTKIKGRLVMTREDIKASVFDAIIRA